MTRFICMDMSGNSVLVIISNIFLDLKLMLGVHLDMDTVMILRIRLDMYSAMISGRHLDMGTAIMLDTYPHRDLVMNTGWRRDMGTTMMHLVMDTVMVLVFMDMPVTLDVVMILGTYLDKGTATNLNIILSRDILVTINLIINILERGIIIPLGLIMVLRVLLQNSLRIPVQW